ncbi:LamB/YcsF family protein [Flexivirga caeni]|uniref:5-oxoprolinase subunit A n=1 Tax=Flexivirga caeni TaxID=2294115 RepID=A0A3M9M9K5_9MICO|nr:5-oxoprolinase subunit PxpA [Flexivirga caeni]RNI21543.1 LamB/YcsF family protein [Flexivirga caeni]
MRVDLNADLGESFGRWRLGDDEALLPLVSSANVACGFHAGDPATLVRTCAAAAAQGVRIGAQVSYRDLAGFGRRFIDVTPDDLYADVLYQIGALDQIARSTGSRVSYVKPHGALYNAVVHHEEQAAAIVAAVVATGRELPVLGLSGSALLAAASAAGLRVIPEGFADRAYSPAGTLVPRTEPGAVLDDAATIAQRAVRMARDHQVVAIDGTVIDVAPESVCVHGDSPGAVAMASAVRAALAAAGVEIRSFADGA